MFAPTHGGEADWVSRACIWSLVPAIVLVGLRMFTRWYILRTRRLDDLLLVLALLMSVGESVSILFEIKGGLGRRIMTLIESDLILWGKSFWISMHFYGISLTLTRLSILLGYISVFPYPRVILASKIMISFILVMIVFGTFSICLFCSPIARFWDKSIPGKCHKPEVEWIVFAALNMVADLAIILIPMPVISRLNLAFKPKLWLIVVLSLGWVVVIVSIIRIPTLIVTFKLGDPTLYGTGAAMLSIIETNIAICCASLPPLRSFATRYIPSLVSFKSEEIASAPPDASSNVSGLGLKESQQSTFTAPQMAEVSLKV